MRINSDTITMPIGRRITVPDAGRLSRKANRKMVSISTRATVAGIFTNQSKPVSGVLAMANERINPFPQALALDPQSSERVARLHQSL